MAIVHVPIVNRYELQFVSVLDVIGKAKVSDIDGTIRLVTMDKFNVPVEIEVPSITELE